jgi:DNA invertase Pin-like site-specific DNA recombinase/uncharacterized Zn finger protein (UPF0148 family)
MVMATGVKYVPIDERDPATVRAVILARSSDPSAKPEDMRGQVEECQEFIARKKWALVRDAYAFAESATGMRNVARPILEEVLRLAVTDEVDVIVTREFERVARTKGRRYQAIQTALDFGVEFRFANLPPDGKLPDTAEARLMMAVKEMMAEAEAEKIAERMGGPKKRLLIAGLPHSGGRGDGPLYGYVGGERREGKHGKPMGLLTWEIDAGDEGTARWVTFLFDTVDATPTADVSQSDLARQLNTRGVRTATGMGVWGATQVKYILTNPKYCGQGRNARWAVEWRDERDAETGRVRPVSHARDRMRDPQAWADETYSVVGIPAIVTPEQFERVQQKLRDAAALQNRGGARRTDAEALSTLLNDGYVYCAACGRKMVRYWSSSSKHVYYQCMTRREAPTNPHRHEIRASETDTHALRLLARALTDPEHILALADAAEQQHADAQTDAALAQAHLVVVEKRLVEIAAEQDKLMTAIKALSGVPGMDDQVQGIRAKLTALDREREEAQAEYTQAGPRRDHTQERADFLRNLFTTRDEYINFTPPYPTEEEGEPHLQVGWEGWQRGPHGERMRTSHVPLRHAAALLGVTEDDLADLDLPIASPGYSFTVEHEDGTSVEDHVQAEVNTADVVYLLLERQPREQIRALLHRLDAVILVGLARSRADWVTHGKTPVYERVALRVMGRVIRMEPIEWDGGTGYVSSSRTSSDFRNR